MRSPPKAHPFAIKRKFLTIFPTDPCCSFNREPDVEDPQPSEAGAELPSSGFSCNTNTLPLLGPRRNAFEAVMWTSIGILLCGFSSVPLASSLTDLANAAGLHSYLVAFVVMPAVLLSVEVPDWLEQVARRRQRNASTVVSQVGMKGVYAVSRTLNRHLTQTHRT